MNTERREIVLVRNLKISDKNGTFGDLDTGAAKYKILERPKPGLVDDHPCVPPTDRGYDGDWTTYHPHHQPGCYELKVPGRTAILIHSANVFEQLLGCLAPGLSIENVSLVWEGKNINHIGISQSRVALAALIEDLAMKPIRLIIKEA